MQPRSLLALIAVTWGVAGLLGPHLAHAGELPNEVWVVQSLVTGFLLFVWCKAHARAHAIELPTGAALLVGFVAPIGVPYYALRGYGLGAGLRLIGKAIGMLVACEAIYVACYVASAWLAG